MRTWRKYRGWCKPGPPTCWIKQRNGQRGAPPAGVSPLSLARRRRFEPARSVSLHQLGNPGSSREPSNLLYSSIFCKAWERTRQTLGERRNKSICRIMWSVQGDVKDFPSSSVTFIIHRTRVSFWWRRLWIKAKRKPRVAKKMSGCKWGWSEHNLQLQLSQSSVYFDIRQ